MLIDASILLPVFRGKSGRRREHFRRYLRGRDFKLTRITQIELLRGCKSLEQWSTFEGFLESQDYVEMNPESGSEAARILFELGRRGRTVAILDCCIAQLAIENRVPLLHNDCDFETIAKLRKLRHQRFDFQSAQ